jgi:hypothetical protein
VVVRPVVVIVADALAGGVTVAGLTAHAGVDVVACVDETWQLRATVPVKPLTTPIVMLEEDVPPGATASGENWAACRVKSAWAAAAGSSMRKAAIPHNHKAACPARFSNLYFKDLYFSNSDFNMSRFK